MFPIGPSREAIDKANSSSLRACRVCLLIEPAGVAQSRHGIARQAVSINYPDWDARIPPFGGYKQSGNGKEYADWGIYEFLETKGIVGYGTA
jgi:aldehyde dehydrogenase (NAD+)